MRKEWSSTHKASAAVANVIILLALVGLYLLLMIGSIRQ
jgi:hypothetical protein